MSAALQQIKVAYENQDMTPDEIAEDLAIDVVAVKSGLMQTSSKYRKACGAADVDDDTLNFSNDELRAANRAIYELLVTTEDEHIKLKAAIYLRDDKKGRKEIVKQQQGATFNILSINEAIQAARNGASRLRDSVSHKVIEA